jgi:hypothetical protein
MVKEVIDVLHCFLGYAKTFSQEKVHMMLALMLDPCFKGMDHIMDHISRDKNTYVGALVRGSSFVAFVEQY